MTLLMHVYICPTAQPSPLRSLPHAHTLLPEGSVTACITWPRPATVRLHPAATSTL